MHLDVMSRTPVYEQIINEVQRFILTGVLLPGDQLPSVRGLSVELSINPNTVLKAYEELDHQGLILAIPGKGFFVRENVKELLRKQKLKKLQDIKAQLTEIALAGIQKQEVYSCVDDAYASAEVIDGGKINDRS